MSVVTYTELRPFVARMNEQSGDVASLVPKPKPAEGEEQPVNASDAVVGGSTNA